MSNNKPGENGNNWRSSLHTIIFEAETPAGKTFDVLLLWSIILSVVVVMLDSIAEVNADYGGLLWGLEWFFTILFSIEYFFRLICVNKPLRYAFSFYGIIDFLAIIPTYLSLVFVGYQYMLVIRIIRLLRIFRIFKLTHLIRQASILVAALKASRGKIIVFLLTVFSLVVIIGSMMYVIEGPENGFTNIPTSIYWAIVTLTTVGYGDISPNTPLGQFLASIVMIIGYAIIAVPTGIVTVELAEAVKKTKPTTEVCPNCLAEGHDKDAVHCKYCGTKI
ncbi:ion transporter [Bacteroidota bacterium]